MDGNCSRFVRTAHRGVDGYRPLSSRADEATAAQANGLSPLLGRDAAAALNALSGDLSMDAALTRLLLPFPVTNGDYCNERHDCGRENPCARTNSGNWTVALKG